MQLLQEMIKLIPRDRLNEATNTVQYLKLEAKVKKLEREYADTDNFVSVRHEIKAELDKAKAELNKMRADLSGMKPIKEVKEEALTEDPKNAWVNRMKKKGATEFSAPKTNRHASNEFSIAHKIEDGEKVIVGKFSNAKSREVSEASLGSKIEYLRYAEWKKDLPKGSTFHKDAPRERAQALGKDFEGVAGTWNSETKTGWIYAYYLNKKNLVEAVKMKTFTALDVHHNPDDITVLVKSNEEEGDGYYGISVVFHKAPSKKIELVSDDEIADEEIKKYRKTIITVAASRVD